MIFNICADTKNVLDKKSFIRLITGANIHKFKPDNNSQNLRKTLPRRWRSGLERFRLGSGRLGVRIPAATDLSRKNS